jgi:hypothetical protein
MPHSVEAMIALSSLCTLTPIIASLTTSNSVACILVPPEDREHYLRISAA